MCIWLHTLATYCYGDAGPPRVDEWHGTKEFGGTAQEYQKALYWRAKEVELCRWPRAVAVANAVQSSQTGMGRSLQDDQKGDPGGVRGGDYMQNGTIT